MRKALQRSDLTSHLFSLHIYPRPIDGEIKHVETHSTLADYMQYLTYLFAQCSKGEVQVNSNAWSYLLKRGFWVKRHARQRETGCTIQHRNVTQEYGRLVPWRIWQWIKGEEDGRVESVSLWRIAVQDKLLDDEEIMVVVVGVVNADNTILYHALKTDGTISTDLYDTSLLEYAGNIWPYRILDTPMSLVDTCRRYGNGGKISTVISQWNKTWDNTAKLRHGIVIGQWHEIKKKNHQVFLQSAFYAASAPAMARFLDGAWIRSAERLDVARYTKYQKWKEETKRHVQSTRYEARQKVKRAKRNFGFAIQRGLRKVRGSKEVMSDSNFSGDDDQDQEDGDEDD